ncbi:hypothetical protein ACN38_g12911, partial [Penicillium nordicum]
MLSLNSSSLKDSGRFSLRSKVYILISSTTLSTIQYKSVQIQFRFNSDSIQIHFRFISDSFQIH